MGINGTCSSSAYRCVLTRIIKMSTKRERGRGGWEKKEGTLVEDICSCGSSIDFMDDRKGQGGQWLSRGMEAWAHQKVLLNLCRASPLAAFPRGHPFHPISFILFVAVNTLVREKYNILFLSLRNKYFLKNNYHQRINFWKFNNFFKFILNLIKIIQLAWIMSTVDPIFTVRCHFFY